MDKPIVHYIGIPHFEQWLFDPETIVGYLTEVTDHPSLGNCHDVRTSKIVKHMDKHGRFETINTIYEPYQNS